MAKEKIVFFGSGNYVLPIIENLIENFDLALVVTTEKNSTDPVVKYCNSNRIKVLSVPNSKTLTSHLSLFTSKVVVLASFGLIVPDSVLNVFPLGIINIHPSLLPKFRGPTPVQSAILAGETKTGVSIIKLDEQVDHGPILVQREVKIESNDTSESLYKKLFELGANLIVENLPKYIAGELKLIEQNHSLATYTDHLTRQSGFIDFTHVPPAMRHPLERMIRAYYPWPGVWLKAKLNGVERIVKLLPEQKIQVEGKNIMTLKDFINGYTEGKEILEKLNIEIVPSILLI